MKRITLGTFFNWIILFALLTAVRGSEDPVARWSENSLVLDNGAVLRKIVYDAKKHAIRTTELKLPGNKFNFVGRSCEEFAFEIDGKTCRGNSGWEVKSVTPMTAEHEGQGATVVLQSTATNPAKIELKIDYLLYPKLPVVRKRLVLKNLADQEVKLESLDVENLQFYARCRDNYHIYANYARACAGGALHRRPLRHPRRGARSQPPKRHGFGQRSPGLYETDDVVSGRLRNFRSA